MFSMLWYSSNTKFLAFYKKLSEVSVVSQRLSGSKFQTDTVATENTLCILL